ncbi:hypothetical protein, partial [Acinetobacter baumannii]|uniref:hypothetical protein n=1 Tax=Acinetobacter baumannii TaxID=470 RepID=UPI001D1874AC
DDLQRCAPIPFRRQNGGDHLIPALTCATNSPRSGSVSPCTWSERYPRRPGAVRDAPPMVSSSHWQNAR